MLAPIRGVSGIATSPAHSFTDFPRSGMYAVSADEMRYAVNGVDRMRWQAGGLPTQTYNVATGLWEDLEPVGVVGPNLLDNSNFQICQRGYNVGLFAPAGIDRWLITGGDISMSQQLYNSDGEFGNVMRVQRTGTGLSDFRQWILTTNSSGPAAGKTMTLRFKVRGVGAATVGLKMQTVWLDDADGVHDLTELFVFDAPETAVGFTERVHTFTVPAYTGTGTPKAFAIKCAFDDAPASIHAVDFTDFKLEEGNTFTGYEPTPYAVDETECVKWFQFGTQRIYGNPSVNNGLVAGGVFPIFPKMYSLAQPITSPFSEDSNLSTNQPSVELVGGTNWAYFGRCVTGGADAFGTFLWEVSCEL
jgi:hypothetical protein